MIELRHVTIRAGAFVLDGLSLSIDAGEYAVLMGRTGRGKTTILEAICGLRPVVSGSIVLGDRDVTHARPADRGVGYVPQDLALFPTMTVREHLEFAPRVRHAGRREAAARADELAELLAITPLLHRRVRGLSGGEAQRVALGRALSSRPPVLLLDEPLSALDESTRDDMYGLLRRVQQHTGVATLHVTHSKAEAIALGSRLLVLDDGVVREARLDELSGPGSAPSICPGSPPP